MPPNRVPETQRWCAACSGTVRMSEPPVISCAAPSAAPNEPRVTISGGIFAARDQHAVDQAPGRARRQWRPGRPTMISPSPHCSRRRRTSRSMVLGRVCRRRSAPMPTDRSMPEVMITKVMPTESTSSTEVSMSRVCRLNRVGKASGSMMLKAANRSDQHQPIHSVFAPDQMRCAE